MVRPTFPISGIQMFGIGQRRRLKRMRRLGFSRRAATPFPVGLDVDTFLFAVAARPADVMRLIVRAYEFNQVMAGLVAALAHMHGALFRPRKVAYGFFSHSLDSRLIDPVFLVNAFGPAPEAPLAHGRLGLFVPQRPVKVERVGAALVYDQRHLVPVLGV